MSIESMENKNQPPQRILDFLTNLEQAINNEYTKDYTNTKQNPWIACFITQLTMFGGLISLMEMQQKMTPVEIQNLNTKWDNLRQTVETIKQEYGFEPPEEIRQKLIASFQNILE